MQASPRLQVAKGHRVELISDSLPFSFLPLPSTMPVSQVVKLKQERVVPETHKGKGKMSQEQGTIIIWLHGVWTWHMFKANFSLVGIFLCPRQMHLHLWRLPEVLCVGFNTWVPLPLQVVCLNWAHCDLKPIPSLLWGQALGMKILTQYPLLTSP